MNSEELIVIRKTNKIEDNLLIVKENWFKSINLCEAYDSYGQKSGCYQAGCYSLDNCASNALKDLKQEISEKFGIEENNINIIESGENFEIEAGDGEEFGFNEDAVNEFISDWREKNEYHIEISDTYTFWNGNNHQTITISDEYGEPDYERIDEKEEEKILSDYENCSYECEGHGFRHYTGEKYNFAHSAWQGSFEIAIVTEKDEE